MNRCILIVLMLAPVAAQAQVEGVRLVYRDPTPITQRRPIGRIFVGDSLIGLTMDATSSIGRVCDYTGENHKDLPHGFGAIASATFAGDHVYLASALKGVVCLTTSDWREVGRTTVPRPDYVGHLGASRDGRHVILVKSMFPDSIDFYARDPESGALTRKRVYQPDDEALVYERMLAEQTPSFAFEVDPQAIRIPYLNLVSDLAIVDTHGETLFLSSANALLAFGRESDEWKHLATAKDNKGGITTMGLIQPYCVSGRGNHVFVSGKYALAWFEFDGTSLECRRWWVDKGSGWEGRPELPFLGNVHSLVVSKNGRFLFLADSPVESIGDDYPIHVLEIGGNDLTHVGSFSAAGNEKWVQQIELSPDGKHLCAQTTDCQLMIFDLDERYWK